MRNSGKRDGDDFGAKRKLKDDVDELFKLPLADFIGARNALATRLKQSGQANDANLVKTLAKPSVSAWTVNQLYWHHRAAFDKLLAAGQRLRGKVTDIQRTSGGTSIRGLLHTGTGGCLRVANGLSWTI